MNVVDICCVGDEDTVHCCGWSVPQQDVSGDCVSSELAAVSSQWWTRRKDHHGTASVRDGEMRRYAACCISRHPSQL